MIVRTVPAIDVRDDSWQALPNTQRIELNEWVWRQAGEQLRGIQRIEYDVIDCPMIRIHRLVKNECGCTQRDPFDPTKLWRVKSEHAIREPLPAWWQPAA